MSEYGKYLICTDEDRLNLLKEHDRTLVTINDDVISIKKWLDKQPHLPKNAIDGKRIEKFILLSKCSIEIAKKRIEMYLSLSTLYPDIYDNMIPESDRIQNTLKYMLVIPLPKVTKNLNRIILFSFLSDYNETYDIIACFLYVMCMVEVRLKYDYKLEDIDVCDMKNVKFTLVGKLTPMLMKTILEIIQGTFGTRVHKIIFINTPPVLEKVITLIKSFVNPKIADRFCVFKDVESMYEYIPRELLPKEYGGNEESMFVLQDKLNKEILATSDEIKKFLSLRVDKSLMPERINDEYLGVEGNFRKLDID